VPYPVKLGKIKINYHIKTPPQSTVAIKDIKNITKVSIPLKAFFSLSSFIKYITHIINPMLKGM